MFEEAVVLPGGVVLLRGVVLLLELGEDKQTKLLNLPPVKTRFAASKLGDER